MYGYLSTGTHRADPCGCVEATVTLPETGVIVLRSIQCLLVNCIRCGACFEVARSQGRRVATDAADDSKWAFARGQVQRNARCPLDDVSCSDTCMNRAVLLD